MVQDAYAIDVLEDTPQRQVINVSLNDVRIRQVTRVDESGVHGVGNVNADYVRGPKSGCQGDVTTLSATAVENHFALKEVFANRVNPVKKFCLVGRLNLGEVGPLIPERSGCGPLLFRK
jgi:hypothetical protein